MLDIEVIGSIAPGAKIVVYFAPNTDQGFLDAITNAIHDTTNKPSVISISWGAPENGWTQQSLTAMNSAIEDGATLGVTIAAAAGDNGSSDGSSDGSDQVDFPASSPWSLACGGTTLTGSGSTIKSEVVWNETANNEGATGGGVSSTFPIPTYQNDANVPAQPATGFAGRGVPDVAGDADPETGYQVIFGGQNAIVGGTSAVAPLWAALTALINQELTSSGKTVIGFANPVLYQNPSAFHDITQGDNGDFNAGPGWDACTGLGSPNGTLISEAFTSVAATAPPSGTGTPTGTGEGGGKREAAPRSARTVVNSSASVPAREQRVPIPGSAPVHASNAHLASCAAECRPNRNHHAPPPQPGCGLGGSERFAAVRSFVRSYGLQIVSEHPDARTLKVEGLTAQMQAAFGVTLEVVGDAASQQHITYQGPLTVPKQLDGVILAVLGLYQRPVAKPRFWKGRMHFLSKIWRLDTPAQSLSRKPTMPDEEQVWLHDVLAWLLRTPPGTSYGAVEPAFAGAGPASAG